MSKEFIVKDIINKLSEFGQNESLVYVDDQGNPFIGQKFYDMFDGFIWVKRKEYKVIGYPKEFVMMEINRSDEINGRIK